jgi:hypothetical protein
MENALSKLRSLSKLDQLAATIIKTAFIMSQAHSVIASYLNHYGANFKVASLKRGGEFVVLCRQICVDRTTYSFIPHNHLEKGLRPDLLIALVMFVNGQKPAKYLFPSTVWQTPNQLFTNSAINHTEYGINVNRKTFSELAEYAFEKQVLNY